MFLVLIYIFFMILLWKYVGTFDIYKKVRKQLIADLISFKSALQKEAGTPE